MKYLKTFEGWNPFKSNNKKVDHGSGYGSDIDSNSERKPKSRFLQEKEDEDELKSKMDQEESDYDLEITEGKLMKSKSVDSDVKKEQFREKINNYIKSQDCKTKQVGDDFEIHYDDEHIAQVMFREDYIGVKKESNKFPKEFGYDEFGKIKKELSSIIKSCK